MTGSISAESGRVPTPPLPAARREPLPWQRPKPTAEDPAAPARVQAILDSPGYREADQDVDFLNRDETRGPRLQLDYMKAELLLREHGVAQTVVVFGATRIRQPDAARQALAACQAAADAAPDDAALRRRLAIARRAMDNSRYYEIARQFGHIVGRDGEHGRGGRILVLTGGGPGIMEAANRGAFESGQESIGLNVTLPHEQYPNPYITPQLCFRFHYFAIRKLHFMLRACALVVFPGGYGTFDELFELLTLIQTRKMQPVPVVLVGEAFWRRVFDPEFLVEEGVIDPEDRDLFWFAESAEQIWADILRWYEKMGRPLLRQPASSR
jgi:uncharacterized protein (TIGR00730 family)